jgi:tight adherence protein C
MVNAAATSVLIGLLLLASAAGFLWTVQVWLRPVAGPGSHPSAKGNRRAPRAPSGGLLDSLARLSLPAPVLVRERYQPVLAHAGFQRPQAVDGFFALLVLGALAGLAFATFVVPSWKLLSPSLTALWVLVPPLAGIVLPVFWLRSLERERQAEIAVTLPDTLDLMKICLDAGLAMEPAMTRVGTELVKRGAVLGDELVLTSAQIQAGRGRAEALRALALRCGVPELSNVVTLLNQTERLGMGVGDVLATAAETSRTRRLQRAEADAARTSVKMIFPLALFLLPAMLLVVLGPAFIQLNRGLAPLLGTP